MRVNNSEFCNRNCDRIIYVNIMISKNWKLICAGKICTISDKLTSHILHAVPLVIDIRELQYKIKRDLYYHNMSL